jgi:opacity protein-like surface antigen
MKLNALSGPPVPGITASVSSRRGGATAGVGTEYMITPNIILGLEYDWIGIDGRNFTSTVSNGGPFVINNRDTDIQEVTARVSFKFW